LTNISLSEEEYKLLFDTIGSKFYDFTDYQTEEEYTKDPNYILLDKLYNKMVRSYNKQNRKYYLWQLIDDKKPVTIHRGETDLLPK